MELKDKIVVVTGAASGIGKGLAKRFVDEGARAVVCADIDIEGAKQTASEIGGNTASAMKMDASVEADIENLIEKIENDIGPIDLFCSNAGILVVGGVEASNDDWQKIWEINVMSHVWAARHLVPRMIERGGGYFLNTVSAAGLLNQIGSAPYGVTKHAGIGLAEWIAITYGDKGIKVSALCPQAVRTNMNFGDDNVASMDGTLEPNEVAEACIKAIRDEVFLVLPHEQVLDYMRNKTENYDRWLGGMRKLNRVYGEQW